MLSSIRSFLASSSVSQYAQVFSRTISSPLIKKVAQIALPIFCLAAAYRLRHYFLPKNIAPDISKPSDRSLAVQNVMKDLPESIANSPVLSFSITEPTTAKKSTSDCFIAFSTAGKNVPLEILKKEEGRYKPWQTLTDSKWGEVKSLKFCKEILFINIENKELKIAKKDEEGKFVVLESLGVPSDILCLEVKDDLLVFSYNNKIQILKNQGERSEFLQTIVLDQGLDCIKIKMGNEFLLAELKGENEHLLKIWKQGAEEQYTEVGTSDISADISPFYLGFSEGCFIVGGKLTNGSISIQVLEPLSINNAIQSVCLPSAECLSLAVQGKMLIAVGSNTVRVWTKGDKGYNQSRTFSLTSSYNIQDLQQLTIADGSLFFMSENRLLSCKLPEIK